MQKIFLILLLSFITFANAEDLTIYPEKINKPTPACEIALCCVFKNEAPWLKEWIEFHRLIGVEHFYLYNNMSSDNYMDILAPYIAEGVIELYHFPVFPFKNTHQPIVYNHALNIAKTNNRWLAIIDTDEFITPMHFNSLKEYLVTKESYGGVVANWQMYGTSYVKKLGPRELLIEKLIMKAPANDPKNVWTKSIVQPLMTLECGPHECLYIDGVQVSRPWVDELRITHYFARTEDFLYNEKINRIKQWNQNIFQINHILDFMPLANSEQDLTMLRFVEPLRNRVFGQAGVTK